MAFYSSVNGVTREVKELYTEKDGLLRKISYTKPAPPDAVETVKIENEAITFKVAAGGYMGNGLPLKYEVHLSRSGFEKTLSSADGTISFTGLTAGTSYTAKARIYNGYLWSDYSTSMTVATTAVYTKPSAPRNLRSTEVTETTVSLAWDEPSDRGGGCSYKVYKNGALYRTVSATVCTVSGLVSGERYTFMVKASNSAGDSANSNSITAQTYFDTHIEDVFTIFANDSDVSISADGYTLNAYWYSCSAPGGLSLRFGAGDRLTLPKGAVISLGVSKADPAFGISITATLSNGDTASSSGGDLSIVLTKPLIWNQIATGLGYFMTLHYYGPYIGVNLQFTLSIDGKRIKFQKGDG